MRAVIALSMIRHLVLITLIVPMLSACAARQQSLRENDPQQISAIEEICSKTIRLQPGYVEFDACRSSLTSSLSYRLKQATDPAVAAGSLSNGASPPSNWNSENYIEVSNALRHDREESACTELGLSNGSGAFTHCVTDLDMELFIVSHPGA